MQPRPIPRDPSFDATLPLLRNPYGFIGDRCRRLRTDVFETRLLLEKTICMTGSRAAEVFYDPRRFVRGGAAPRRVRRTLFGEGGVQTLDGEAHRIRKAMFMSMTTPAAVRRLVHTVLGGFDVYARRWGSMRRVVLYDEVQPLLASAVCSWAGVPLREDEVAPRTRQLVALFDHAGSVGLPHWRARLARARADRWAAGLVAQIRAGARTVPETSAAHAVAWHRDGDGRLLDERTAGVELLNVLRPTVAVSVFVVFAALALRDHPGARQRLRDDAFAERFVQEVRRFYPFFPAVAARVRDAFEWEGYTFPALTLVMLDLYGTNHDPRAWEAPDEFRPDRFLGRHDSPFDFIPQGGGNHFVHHRCPGEWITIALMKAAAQFLASGIVYDVPRQDLRIDRARLPALPRSRFVMQGVRLTRAG